MATDPNQWDPINPTPPGKPTQSKSDPRPGNVIITNPPPQGQQPSTYPTTNLPPGATGVGNAIVQPGDPAAGIAATQAGYAPGTDVYDWHTVNAALTAAGLNGWQIAGTSHTPVNQGKWVKNDAFISSDVTPDVPEYTLQEGGTWVIGAVNPTTGQMLQVTLAKAKQPDGTYNWAVIGRQDQGKVDSTNPGYKEIQRLPFADGHTELWGTNTGTGAFEKLPSQPAGMGEPPPGWSSIKQVEQPDGSLVWMGTPPPGSPQYNPTNPGIPVEVPGMPKLKGNGKYTEIKQVTRNGRRVYVGTNRQTGAIEEIPEYGVENVAPATVTAGSIVYTVGPNGTLVRASGIEQPKEGDHQWVPAGTGYGKQQTFSNGAWHDDVDIPWKTLDPSIARAEAAIRPKGTPYQELINGYLVDVIADGNGGYSIAPGAKGKRIPGTEGPPTTIATANEQEFITQRNPVTNAIEQIRNPSWQPSDIGDRTRQLQQLATAKQKELHDRIGQNGYTAEQADADFMAYWTGEIEPRREQLQFDQEQERLKAQNTQETQRANMLSQARAAGQEAVSNYQAMQPYMVGPGWADQASKLMNAVAQGKTPPSLDASAYMYQMPDLNALAQYHTARALQHISPTAAGLLGGQTSFPTQAQGVDLNALVNRTQYLPSNQPQPVVNVNIGGAPATAGAAPVAAAAPAAVAAGPAPVPVSNLTPSPRGLLVG